MAVDVCSDFCPSLLASPRISFSHDLVQSDIVRSDHFLLEPEIDFDFCINVSSSSPPISSADQLFSNGKILPVQINNTPPNFQPLPTSSTPCPCKMENTQKKMLKDFLSITIEDEDGECYKKLPSKQFWQLRRSSSLNLGGKSLQFLGRSKSTGSVPNPKTIVPQQKVTCKEEIARSVSQKEHLTKRSSSQKESKILPRSSSVSSSTQFYAFSSGKKASLRKSCNNVIRINPVLNITPTFFTKATVNLFGLCSFLSNGKSNKKKK